MPFVEDGFQFGKEFLKADIEGRAKLYMKNKEYQSLYLQLSEPKVVDLCFSGASSLCQLFFELHNMESPECCAKKPVLKRCLDTNIQKDAFKGLRIEHQCLLIRELREATQIANLIDLLPTETWKVKAYVGLFENWHRSDLLKLNQIGKKLLQATTNVQIQERWYEDRPCIATSDFIKNFGASGICTICSESIIENITKIRVMSGSRLCHVECFREGKGE